MEFTDARNYKKEIKQLYASAFPRNERAPLSFLFRRTDNGRDCFYAVLDNGEFIGLVYTIQAEMFVYVFFLAVAEEKRGRGYGSKILKAVRELYPDKAVTLLIEDTEDASADNYEERIKRLGFYESNGFRRMHVKVNEAGVVYELLGTQDTVTGEDYLALMKDYFGAFLFGYIYRKNKRKE